MPTRREVLTVLGGTATAAVLGSGCAASRASGSTPAGLDDTIARLAGAASADQAYRAPTSRERDAVLAAVDDLVGGDVTPSLAARFDELGFDAGAGTDAATGRGYRLAVSRSGTERAWGALAVDADGGRRVLIEVPHLRSDLHTEDLGLALFRAVPGASLLVAGAHRRADGGRADVAHHTDSLFHAIAGRLGDRGRPEVQLHGFDDASLPDVDAVISPGAGPVNPLAKDIARSLGDAGFTVCTAWSGDDCGSLEGRTNVQGRAAAAAKRPFVHVELSPRLRDQDRKQADTARALARALLGRVT